MIVMRKGVWETNSSAVHTLCYSNDGLEPSHLPTDKDGYIVIDFAAFPEHSENLTTFDQNTKLSYLATECYYLNHWDEHIDNFYIWEHVRKAVCEYTGARGIRIEGCITPELNHQVIPEYELKFCDAYDEDSIINFIFNKNVGIKMYHD